MLLIDLSVVLGSLDINTKRLVRETLTLIEASQIPEGESKNALKSMIKHTIWQKNRELREVLNSMIIQGEN